MTVITQYSLVAFEVLGTLRGSTQSNEQDVILALRELVI